MTNILPLTFEDTTFPVIVTLSTGQTYTALTLDWNFPRKDWAAPTGVMLEVADPTANAPVGQRLRVFVPWNSIKYITQVIAAPPTEGFK